MMSVSPRLAALLFQALAASLCLAHPLQAEGPTRATAPIYGGVVVFAVPPGFEAAHEAEDNGAYILELVPGGQSVEDWDEMLTLTGIGSAVEDSGMTAKDLVDWGLQQLGDGYQAGCARPIISEVFNDAPPKGAEDAALAHFGCPELRQTGLSEQALLWVAVGQGNLYTLQWAERGPPQDRMAFDPPQWFDRFDLLSRLSLCAPLPDEQAPYPSCLD